jgi:cbb3-type cytochrome oxidase subunit 1
MGGRSMEAKNQIGVRLIMIASVYMVLALFLGLMMGMSGDHALTTVHSHMSLLGWTTMAITGFVYILRPKCANNALSSIHFWLNNIGLPIMIFGLVLTYGFGNPQADMISGIGSIIVLLSLSVFAINMFKNLRNE